jgi:hypothetical protein
MPYEHHFPLWKRVGVLLLISAVLMLWALLVGYALVSVVRFLL